MKSILKKSWPSDMQETLHYRLGEKPLHEYLLQNAINHPQQTAYTYYGNNITWQQLSDNSRRFAQFLKGEGVSKGDRIALYMQNCPQYLICHYAIQMLGAIVVPLSPMYKEAELLYFINEAEIKAIISAQELYEQVEAVKQQTTSLQFIITTHYTDFLPEAKTLPLPDELKIEKKKLNSNFDLLEEIQSNNPISETEQIDIWEDVGLMVFTSGTTGRPKAAMLTYGNALFKTAATAQGYQMKQSDITLAVAPLCHIAGMVMGVNLPVYNSLSCILLTRFDVETAVKAIEDYKVNKLYTVATMNAAILNFPEIEQRNLTSLELNFATSFGTKVDQNLAEAWEKVTGGCVLLEASYGLSETHTCDTFMPIENIKFGTCGIATYDTEIRIVDIETGEDLPPGVQGEIVIKNPGVFKGYLNRPDATKETLKGGWVFTGDIGMLDEEGFLYFNGRVKEMIKSSGYSVFPEDVEALLNDHEAILQVAAIGVPDKNRGESVKAYIVLNPAYKGKVSERDIIKWSKEKMAAYKYPRDVEFLDSLPATSSGKVLRRLLKEDR
ncbi:MULTISPECIES: AMP-binding protein [Oceanobacillus]|uniref:Long-chain-fatty-acid--CoA ligase n=1 Tax=Oceanobacillus indicireducens TaxID=1004261 RepID=A0A917XST4_9BACI|nr:AMP-binding protein [Oceanobacillus indicireducens]GGN52332.1 long-chain-fatty-acid--CoA ligase [Oceanobacillus indicireducens]